MNEIKLDPANCLLHENTCNIFSWLGIEGVEICRQVSKLWNKIASDDQVWMAIVPGIKDIIKLDKNVVELIVRDYVKNHAVTSLKDLSHRFVEFNSKVSVKGSFDCFFPFNPGCHFNAKVQYAYCDWMGRTPELKKQWICVRELPNDERDNQAHSDSGTGIQPTSIVTLIQDKLCAGPSFDFESKSILPVNALEQQPSAHNAIATDFNEKANLVVRDELLKRQKPAKYIAEGTTTLVLNGVCVGTVFLIASIVGRLRNR